MNAKELGEKLHAKRTEWRTLWDSKSDKTFSDAEIDTLTQLNSEMTDLAKKYETAAALEETAARTEREIKEYNRPLNRLETPVAATGKKSEYKSFHDFMIGWTDISAFRSGHVKATRIEIPDETLARDLGMKTLLTSGDWDIVADRQPGLVDYPIPEITVSDLMLSGRTSSNAITYMSETTHTNAAVEVAEGSAKPESALDFTLRTDAVRKIATWIPVTDEMLDDVPAMESYIRGRLAFMVKQREEQQLLVGNGTAPNISGILDRSGIQTQAKGADPTPDAVYKAMTKVRVTGAAEPTAAVFHPNDWQDVRLLRTADGIYIWGSPADAGPERIWGLTVRQTTGITENTALVGAFRPFAQVFRRSGLTVELTRDYDTYRTENKALLIAETRLALAVYREQAFCSVTGV
jgi:HK97 family phage major capsid protein